MGGATDILGRAVVEFLTKDLKQSVVVENKPGAQGAIVVYRPQSPEAITKFIDDDRDRWTRIIRTQNISID